MKEITANLSEQSILVVDNEPDNLELLKVTLEVMHNAVVCTVGSCQEALAQLETFQPTLVITDISMPFADGFILLEMFRQRPDTQELPIFALTAHAMQGDRERMLAAGFDGYLSKPFDVLRIGTQLEILLRNFIATSCSHDDEGLCLPQLTPASALSDLRQQVPEENQAKSPQNSASNGTGIATTPMLTRNTLGNW